MELNGMKETKLDKNDQEWLTKNKLMNHHDDVKKDIYRLVMEMGGYGEYNLSLYTEEGEDDRYIYYRSRYTVSYLGVKGDDNTWQEEDQKQIVMN